VVGIWMALTGWEAFALAWQMVAMWATRTVCLWVLSPWRPGRQFSFSALKPLFLFAWKLVVSSLLATFFQNLYQLIIPKLFSQTALGYYDRGLKFPQLLMMAVNSTLGAVMFPVLSAIQDDRERMRSAVKRSFTVVAFLLWPLMIGLLMTADPVIRILLTDKWLPAAPYMRIFCFTMCLSPLHSGNLQVLNATGHSGLFFLCEVLKRIVNVLAIVLTYQHGLYAMVLATIPASFVMLAINCMFSGHFIRYPVWRQLYDLLPVAAVTAAMAGALYGVAQLPIESLYLAFAVQVVTGALSYLVVAHVFKIQAYIEVRTLVAEKLSARRKR
jgi:teichuronic acid exporter